jgi:heptosyltransferase-3
MCEQIEAQVARYSLAAGRCLLDTLVMFRFRPMAGQTVRHVVVYRVGNIGDTVVAIPALTAIREAFPEAIITLLTSSGSSELPGAAMVLEAFPGLVNRIVSYLPSDIKNLAGLRRLRSEVTAAGGVDLFVDLPISMQTLRRGLQELFLAHWLGSRSALGFALPLPEVFKSAYCRQMPEQIPQTADWLCAIVVQALGMPDREIDPLRFFKPPSQLDRAGLEREPDRPLLVVNAGAKLAIKRWPAAHFRETIRQLHAQVPGLQTVLVGSLEERSLNDEIAADLPDVANLAGQLSLSETWALLSQAKLVLSNDTGTMHMAGLLQKPVFAPMGGQYPAPLWHPPGKHFISFRHPVPCAPCFRDTCPLPEQSCLTAIAPETVASALAQNLQAPESIAHANNR